MGKKSVVHKISDIGAKLMDFSKNDRISYIGMVYLPDGNTIILNSPNFTMAFPRVFSSAVKADLSALHSIPAISADTVYRQAERQRSIPESVLANVVNNVSTVVDKPELQELPLAELNELIEDENSDSDIRRRRIVENVISRLYVILNAIGHEVLKNVGPRLLRRYCACMGESGKLNFQQSERRHWWPASVPFCKISELKKGPRAILFMKLFASVDDPEVLVREAALSQQFSASPERTILLSRFKSAMNHPCLRNFNFDTLAESDLPRLKQHHNLFSSGSGLVTSHSLLEMQHAARFAYG
ncbi:hypothetical protein BKA69DRAFT_97578 [Paraphysoderma sedebokerense]|nr:hypothetical protein BKA69DRAFT_97578 [Paraphysoderma sedebokerense]